LEHRLRIAHALSATATLGVAALAFAAVDGGLFAHAAPATSAGAKTIEIVDDYIVVHSPTTTTPPPSTTEVTQAVIEAARLAAIAPAPQSAPALVAAAPPLVAPAPTQVPAAAPSVDEQSDEGPRTTMPGSRERDHDEDRAGDDDHDAHEQESDDDHESEDDD
jgi:hypothetical protein